MKFIFLVRIKEGYTVEEYIEAWKAGSTIIQGCRGARGTMLYKKTGDPKTLIAIATWESKAARDEAMRLLGFTPRETRTILKKHEKLADIEIIGHFEEVAEVDPPELIH